MGWRLRGGWGRDVESPHVLPSLFRADEAKMESEVGVRRHEPEV